MKMPNISSVPFGPCAVFITRDCDVTFTPGEAGPEAGFELVSQSGFIMWGENWSRTGHPRAMPGPAVARGVWIKGRPHLDIERMDGAPLQRGAQETQSALRIPAVDLMAIAPLEARDPAYHESIREELQALCSERTRQMH